MQVAFPRVTFSLCIDRLWQAFASETYYCYINKVSVNVLPVNGWNKGNRHIDTSTTFNIMYITYSARLTLFTERNSKLQYTKIIHYELWFKVIKNPTLMYYVISMYKHLKKRGVACEKHTNIWFMIGQWQISVKLFHDPIKQLYEIVLWVNHFIYL